MIRQLTTITMVVLLPVFSAARARRKLSCGDVMKIYNGDVKECLKAGKYVYWRNNKRMPWKEASDECHRAGDGHLMSIHNTRERVMAQELAKNNNNFAKYENEMWIGLFRIDSTPTDRRKECIESYRWTDGSDMNYQYWLRDRRYGGPTCRSIHEACGTLLEAVWYDANYRNKHTIHGWQDRYCDYKIPSLCKAEVRPARRQRRKRRRY